MKISTLFLSVLALVPAVTSTTRIQKRWLNGDNATGTTDPDVISDCKYWANNVSSSDSCSKLEAYFDITFTQLKAWNPSLLQDYCVFVDGWSYCVEGPAVPANASTATSVDAANSTSPPSSTFTEVDDPPSNSTNATASATIPVKTETSSASSSSSAVLRSSAMPISSSFGSFIFISSLLCLFLSL